LTGVEGRPQDVPGMAHPLSFKFVFLPLVEIYGNRLTRMVLASHRRQISHTLGTALDPLGRCGNSSVRKASQQSTSKLSGFINLGTADRTIIVWDPFAAEAANVKLACSRASRNSRSISSPLARKSDETKWYRMWRKG
jgi:hypothetical protein